MRPNWARQREKGGSDDDEVYGSWPPYTLSGHSEWVASLTGARLVRCSDGYPLE